MLSDDDLDYEFRVGLVREENPRIIFWLKPGWSDRSTGSDFKFIANIGEIIIVQKRNKKTHKISEVEWNVREKWPSNAQEGSAVASSWTF